MRTPTAFATLIHIAALAVAAIGMMGAPKMASAETYSTKPCRIVAGTDGCAPTSGLTSKLPSSVIAAKNVVETRGVGLPNLKPNVCNTASAQRFKGCGVF